MTGRKQLCSIEACLLPQLLGRLMGFGTIAATGFLEKARDSLSPPAIITLRPSLTRPAPRPPGSKATGFVSTLCLLPDGRLASGSNDNTIRLWDIAALREITRLEIDAPASCLVALSDNRLVAGDWLGLLHWLEIIL